ncbi:MAG: DUF2851 family protein [Muribaculaceae bacterium]|nr:DUF2851 family protein [Muribaculaceae bacterium]
MEMLYQYIWKYRLLPRDLSTTDGVPVKVVSPGVHNSDAGPDFSGARIRIGTQEWAGNVEVHVKASDWFAHNHDSDPAYSNVILHFVAIHDRRIPDGHGGYIPQVSYQLPEAFERLYGRLADKIASVKCEGDLWRLSPLTVTNWLETLSVERMQMKASRIIDEVNHSGGDWQQAAFVTLARALGFSLNSQPLEMLARSLPLNILAKHSNDAFQIEAFLFGQAGMLDTSLHIFDEYYQRLCREYLFLARKYGLKPMRSDLWKYSKTRPQNFPTRRIALLSRLVTGGFNILSEILDSDCDKEVFVKLIDLPPEGYWAEHIDFDKPGSNLASSLSDGNVDLLMINFTAPMLYAYGSAHGNPDIAERGLDIWCDTNPENNTYIRQWKNAGLPCASASDSQALLQLRKEYCDRAQCLRCRFGHALLREASDASDIPLFSSSPTT